MAWQSGFGHDSGSCVFNRQAAVTAGILIILYHQGYCIMYEAQQKVDYESSSRH